MASASKPGDRIVVGSDTMRSGALRKPIALVIFPFNSFITSMRVTSDLIGLPVYSRKGEDTVVDVIVNWRSIHKRSYDCFPTYASRTPSIPHRLLFTKDGARTIGVNMSVNLRHTCLCRTTVIAGHFSDCYQL